MPQKRFSSLIPLFLSAFAVQSLDAQRVRGGVWDEGGAGIPGVVVGLLSGTKQVTEVLTDDLGHFELVVPAHGTYSLRTMRVGFKSTTSAPFDVAAGETVERRLTASSIASRLTDVVVSANRGKCMGGGLGEGSEVAKLWDEAKIVLYATSLTQDKRAFETKITQHERGLDKRGVRVEWEKTWDEWAAVSENAFASIPADDLSRHGYVHRDSINTAEYIYYAPDAHILLSETFIADHCFRVQRSAAGKDTLIGLAFEPVKGRKLPDVKGVLWLDPRSAKLLYLDFLYTELVRKIPRDKFGGRISFSQLPSGAWFVDKWVIKMPILVQTRLPGRDSTVPGGALVSEARIGQVFVGVRERGATVVPLGSRTVAGNSPRTSASTIEAGSTAGTPEEASQAPDAIIEGVVFDSTSGAPLAGAKVSASGSSRTALTSSDGRFEIDSLAAGPVSLTFTHPRIDSLGMTVAKKELALRHGERLVAELSVPSSVALMAAECGEGTVSVAAGAGMIRGQVQDASNDEPLANAIITAQWLRQAGGKERDNASATSDASGRYAICGIPPNTRVVVRGEHAKRPSDSRRVQLSPASVSIVHFRIQPGEESNRP
ncbi:MAG: carboxypeptidase regulatory-like domain-containing protein [Anaerolineae bacterium]|nr:carboxypeptidase regulatory-like domain-containing protein [Gemmatimonadaceae bacterium]